jgi:hypothetical protein
MAIWLLVFLFLVSKDGICLGLHCSRSLRDVRYIVLFCIIILAINNALVGNERVMMFMLISLFWSFGKKYLFQVETTRGRGAS